MQSQVYNGRQKILGPTDEYEWAVFDPETNMIHKRTRALWILLSLYLALSYASLHLQRGVLVVPSVKLHPKEARYMRDLDVWRKATHAPSSPVTDSRYRPPPKNYASDNLPKFDVNLKKMRTISRAEPNVFFDCVVKVCPRGAYVHGLERMTKKGSCMCVCGFL
jgi:hypothetical protein